METWINETLSEAENMEIPGIILKPAHKTPLLRYGIDRDRLTGKGISPENVDRIYRCLFVYSIGFFELLKECNCPFYSVISVWKVFGILLEYCCKSDYQLMISELGQIHQDEIDEVDKQHQAEIKEYVDEAKIKR